MGNAGVLAMADALRTNSSLMELILELDKIPAEEVDRSIDRDRKIYKHTDNKNTANHAVIYLYTSIGCYNCGSYS